MKWEYLFVKYQCIAGEGKINKVSETYFEVSGSPDFIASTLNDCGAKNWEAYSHSGILQVGSHGMLSLKRAY